MLCLLLSGEAGLMHLTARGEQETDDTCLLIVNAAHEQATQKLPVTWDGAGWQTLPAAPPGLARPAPRQVGRTRWSGRARRAKHSGIVRLLVDDAGQL